MLTTVVHPEGSKERREEIRALRGTRIGKFMLQRGILHFREVARALCPNSNEEFIDCFARAFGGYAAGKRTLPLETAFLLGKTYKKNAHFFYLNYIDENEKAAIKRLWHYSIHKLRATITHNMNERKIGTSTENGQDTPRRHTASGNGNGKVEPSVPLPTASVGTDGSISPTTFTYGPSSYEWSGCNGIHDILVTNIPEQEARLLFSLLRLTAGQPQVLDGLCKILQKTLDPAQSQ